MDTYTHKKTKHSLPHPVSPVINTTRLPFLSAMFIISNTFLLTHAAGNPFRAFSIRMDNFGNGIAGGVCCGGVFQKM